MIHLGDDTDPAGSIRSELLLRPVHGGNANLAGWKLVGFPGPLMDYRVHVDAHFGEAWRPAPKSLEQVTGHRFAPWEDERGE